ncbi:MAG: VWA domain-containing protein [Isosphaeraceae bacterium]|nr:VWA domain-containing protein [Isosphaeraceae bacterium]
MRYRISVSAVIGLCLCVCPASAQDAPPDKQAPEEGLRRMLVDPQEQRTQFPRVDAPDVILRESKRPNERYDPNRPAQRQRLQDLDPRKSYYGNGTPPFPHPPHRIRLDGDFDPDRNLDLLAREILRFQGAERRPLTVVWLFDQTRSMLDDRPIVRWKLQRILREIEREENEIQEAFKRMEPRPKEITKEALQISHLVIGFGKSSRLVTLVPTRNLEAVEDAFESLAVDESGIENTFHAIAKAIREARQTVAETTRLLLVVVTDESGNDDEFLEDALDTAIKKLVPVYVIGRQALFGTTLARLGSPPDDARLPTIRRGPESADIEVLAWDGLQPRDDEQPAGFAPYGLARLALHTGGIYLMLPSEEAQRVRQREKAYSIVSLRGYEPEYTTREAYLARRESSPLRRALFDTIQATRDFSLPLRFPYEPRPLVESLRDAADKAERQWAQLIPIEAKLRALRDDRAVEPSKRWQAHYDLMLAQVVAFQITRREYRAAIVALRRTASGAIDGAPEIWDLTHGRECQAPKESTEASYREAERLLKLVIERHPYSPWADLAQTIRERGLSVKWHASRLKDAPPRVTGSHY